MKPYRVSFKGYKFVYALLIVCMSIPRYIIKNLYAYNANCIRASSSMINNVVPPFYPELATRFVVKKIATWALLDQPPQLSCSALMRFILSFCAGEATSNSKWKENIVRLPRRRHRVLQAHQAVKSTLKNLEEF